MNRGKAHSKLVKACRQYLEMRGCWAQTNTTMARKTEDGRFLRAGTKGSADILGCTPRGTFIAVECKTGTGRLTKEQQAFRDAIEHLGGIHVVARALDDVHDALETDQ